MAAHTLSAERGNVLVTWLRSRGQGWRWWLLCAAPILGAIVFVRSFASPMPLTDEWFFTKSIVTLQRFDLHSTEGLEAAYAAMPKRFVNHWVVVPFLVYWPISEWTDFDSRWFIYITLITFVVEALLFWRCLFRRSLWAFPIALILLCPSHYMEFMWGWQFTLALSILFSLAGLVVVDRISPDQRLTKQAILLSTGLFACLLGLLSSAGGFFGFPCILLLLWLKPLRLPVKVICLAIGALAMFLAYTSFMDGAADQLHFGSRQVLMALTALGGTIFGTPVGLFEFGLDLRSMTGLLILACFAVVLRRASILGAYDKLALAIAITTFGLLCTASIAVARTVLGNWHLQYSLLAVCGVYAAAYQLWKADKSRIAAVTFFTMFALSVACLFSWWKGFAEYGPDYNRYIQSIETYSRNFLEHPGAPKPQPPPVDVNVNMMLFLSAHHHPVFGDVPASHPGTPLPESARVFSNTKEIGADATITVEAWKMSLLTVVFPDGIEARSLTARIGNSDVVLRRIHPVYCNLACSHEPGAVSFAALIVPRVLGAGDHPMSLSIGP